MMFRTRDGMSRSDSVIRRFSAETMRVAKRPTPVDEMYPTLDRSSVNLPLDGHSSRAATRMGAISLDIFISISPDNASNRSQEAEGLRSMRARGWLLLYRSRISSKSIAVTIPVR